MSILQGYAKLKGIIGDKRWEAIEEYLNEVTTEENYQDYNADMLDAIFTQNLTGVALAEIDAQLKEKYNIILLSDVLYTKEGSDTFEAWCKENKKG